MNVDQWWKSIGAYALALFLCLSILTVTLNLWQADISVPFEYSGDALQAQMAVKSVIDNGWYLHNDFLGVPAGQDMYDFPMGDTLDFLIMKMIALFTQDYAAVMNLFFLLTFPLTTLTSMVVFRQLKISSSASVVGSLLYTFLPYHFLRGESHLFLTSYFMVPLVVLVCLWLFTGKIIFKLSEDGKTRLSLSDPLTLTALVICFVASLTMAYYVFFSCVFLLVTGFSAAIIRRNRYLLIACTVPIAILIFTFLATMLPSLLYQHANGANPYAGVRSAFETEVYGLKIDQLLLPMSEHRIGFLAGIMNRYNAVAPLVNENAYVALGVIGSLGFLLLLGWVFYRLCRGNLENPVTDLIDSLAIMNLSALLLATIGGFGALFAVIYPQFRAINRVSVFIAFFSLMAFLLAVTWFSSRYARTSRGKLAVVGLLILVLVVGIFDQTSPQFIPDYGGVKAQYASDDVFVKQIEATTPPGAMIFQLPYMESPEYSEYFLELNNIRDYDLFRGYLHSDGLLWSFGAVKGRSGDQWTKNVSSMPLEDMVKTLSFAGFSGIYVDSSGYPENDTTLINGLGDILQTKPLVSPDNQLYYFSMAGYSERLNMNLTADARVLMQESAFDPSRADRLTSDPMTVEWRGGFSVAEGNQSDSWRRCLREGELYIVNPSRNDLPVSMNMWLTAINGSTELVIDSDLFHDRITIDRDSQYRRTFLVPHGRHILKFTCYGPESAESGAFVVRNFSMTY